MEEITEIDVSMNNRDFTLTVPIKDQELIEDLIDVLKNYVKNEAPIKARQSYVTSLSDSLQVITKIMPNGAAVDEWRSELKQLMSMILKSGQA